MPDHLLDPTQRHHGVRLAFGAELIGPKRTRFRFWAPSREAVTLELLDDAQVAAALPMQARGEGWFEVETACGTGTRYRYRLDAELAVPDPASRFQPDDVHGPSQVIDAKAYAWRHPAWAGRPWEETVLYELHVGAFGGYRGVRERLPALAQLGITAIKLMPLNDFSGARN